MVGIDQLYPNDMLADRQAADCVRGDPANDPCGIGIAARFVILF